MQSVKPVLFVAGFGRCGTTLIMTMLDRGGFPVAGSRPAFEEDEMSPIVGVNKAWVKAQAGKAVKWIDPLRARISRNDLPRAPVIILMERDVREQARSSVKMVEASGAAIGNRNMVRAMTRSFRRDQPILRARLSTMGTVHRFAFEQVLRDPRGAAAMLGAIAKVEFDHDLDEAMAASMVLPRDPECQPDFAIEHALQEFAQHG